MPNRPGAMRGGCIRRLLPFITIKFHGKPFRHLSSLAVFFHLILKPSFELEGKVYICRGSILSLVQILFSFVFGYGNV